RSPPERSPPTCGRHPSPPAGAATGRSASPRARSTPRSPPCTTRTAHLGLPAGHSLPPWSWSGPTLPRPSTQPVGELLDSRPDLFADQPYGVDGLAGGGTQTNRTVGRDSGSVIRPAAQLWSRPGPGRLHPLKWSDGRRSAGERHG